MNFELSDKTQRLLAQLNRFMAEHVYPIEAEVHHWHMDLANAFKIWPGLEERKAQAREAGLWKDRKSVV